MSHTPHRSLLPTLLLLLLAACGDASSGSPGDTSTTTTTDTLGADTAADAATDTLSAVDDVADGASDAASDKGDLGPAPTPAERPLSIDWAIQSDQSSEASLLAPAITALPDGGFAVMATFDGTVTFGGREVVSDDQNYTHALWTRVTADGEVAALTWLCDRCRGYAQAPMVMLASGNLAFASVAEGEVVLAPGTDAEQTLSAEEPQLLLGVVTPDGGLVRAALVAEVPYSGEVRALIPTPGGGLIVAGNAQGLAVPGGPSFPVEEEGWGYPGRAFFLAADAELNVLYAEQAGGHAGSDVNLLHLEGDALYTVGDFGGYPLGVATTFSVGTPEELELASVSSDDDPAMDIFVARWDVSALSDGRPRLSWARRLSHYSNGPRPGTFARSDGEGGVLLRIDGADDVAPDDQGQVDTVPHYGSQNHLIVRLSASGEASRVFAVPSPVAPAWGGYMSGATWWSGSAVAPAGDDGPIFDIPESTSGPDGVKWSGTVLGRWRADGALLEAGMLLQRVSSSTYPLSIQATLPQADGSVIVVMHGSPSVDLVPSAGEAVSLTRGSGYERLVVTRVRLD